MGRVDDGIALAHEPEVIFTCFGDMLRVPGSDGTLLEAKAEGADVRMVYSPLDALRVSPRRIPSGRSSSSRSASRRPRPRPRSRSSAPRRRGIANFSCLCNHVTIVPPLRALLDSPDLRLDGFIGPGHVSTIVGGAPVRVHPRRLRPAGRDLGVRAGRPPAVDADAPAPARRAAAARSRTSTRASCPARATGARWR